MLIKIVFKWYYSTSTFSLNGTPDGFRHYLQPKQSARCTMFCSDRVMIVCIFSNCCSEDRSALNKLVDALKTNYNDRVDEVGFIMLITV